MAKDGGFFGWWKTISLFFLFIIQKKTREAAEYSLCFGRQTLNSLTACKSFIFLFYYIFMNSAGSRSMNGMECSQQTWPEGRIQARFFLSLSPTYNPDQVAERALSSTTTL